MTASSLDNTEFKNLLAPTDEALTLSEHFQRFLQLPIFPMLGLVCLFVATFLNLINLTLDKDKVAIDLQVMLKLAGLAACGIYGGLGFLSLPKVRQTIFTFPIMWMFLILGFYFLAVPFSLTPTESLASTISIACVMLMTVTVLHHVGPQVVLNIVFAAMTLFVAFSWFVYFAVPEIGVFAEPIPGGEFQYRMSGLAHPNTLGQVSGLTVVVGFLLYFTYKQKWLLIVGTVLLALLALMFSLSRTSLFATVVAVAVVHRHKVFDRRKMIYGLWLGAAGLIGLMILSLSVDLEAFFLGKLSFVAKSGDAEELTSATGRADIWGYTIRLISQRPLTGFGAATTKYHLAEYSSYTHNLILNIAFSSGVLGGLAALAMCLGRLFSLFRSHHAIADALVTFVLINGLFENVIFSFLAGMPTVIWTMGLCLPAMEAQQESTPGILNASLKGRRQ